MTAIDEGHVESTVAQEGKVLHRCRLRCRNTQRQFLRAALPAGAKSALSEHFISQTVRFRLSRGRP